MQLSVHNSLAHYDAEFLGASISSPMLSSPKNKDLD